MGGITTPSREQDTRTSVTVSVSQFHAAGGGDNEAYQALSIHIATCSFYFPFSALWHDSGMLRREGCGHYWWIPLVGLRCSARGITKDERADFGHVFDGVADAFAAEAAVLDAAVGEIIDPPRGDFIDQDPADFELVPGAERMLDARGEHAGVDAVAAVVDFGEGVAEVGGSIDDCDRSGF